LLVNGKHIPIQPNESSLFVPISKDQDPFLVELVPLNRATKIEKQEMSLQVGDTVMEYTLIAEDGTKRDLTITAQRDKFWQSPPIEDPKSLCSICRVWIFRPRLMTCGHSSCASCLDLFQKTKIAQETYWLCPICDHSSTKNPALVSNRELEKVTTETVCRCWFPSCTVQVGFGELYKHAITCPHRPQRCTTCRTWMGQDHGSSCTASCKDCGKVVRVGDSHSLVCNATHPIPILQISPPCDIEKGYIDTRVVIKSAEATLEQVERWKEEYRISLQGAWNISKESQGRVVQRPKVDRLQGAIQLLATSIQKFPSPDLHLALGDLLWESVLLSEWFPEPKKQTKRKDENQEAQDGFMQDEVQGLLLQLGVPPSANEATQIKAMESEYHRLKNLGMANEAAEVQGLIAWKVKSKGVEAGEETGSAKGMALMDSIAKKYRDAIAMNSENAMAWERLALVSLIKGNYQDAIQYSSYARGLQPLSERATWLYSVAILLHGEVMDPREMTTSLESYFLSYTVHQITSETNSLLILDEFHPALDFFHLACEALGTGYRMMGLYKKARKVYENALYIIGDVATMCARDSAGKTRLVSRFGHYLCGLIYISKQTSSTDLDEITASMLGILAHMDIPTRMEMSQYLVWARSSLEHVEALGMVSLDSYHRSNNVKLLHDAFVALQASVDLEVSDAPQTTIRAQQWYKDFVKKLELEQAIAQKLLEKSIPAVAATKGAAKTTKEVSKAPTKSVAHPKETKGTKTNAPPKSTPAKESVTTSNASKSKPQASSHPSKPTKEPPRSDKVSEPRPATAKSAKPASKPPGKEGPKNKSDQAATVPQPGIAPNDSAPEKAQAKIDVVQPAIIRKKRYSSRYWLAQTMLKIHPLAKANQFPYELQMDLTALEKSMTELFLEAIELNPTFHDSYIDLGSFLCGCGKQKEALELYIKYPFHDPPSQDDLYLHTEILQILMKHKDYKSSALPISLVALGRTNGWKSISHYIDPLDQAGESKMLMQVYSQVNRKPMDHVF
jgi:tetratricopeptide (TPR) repeat protein